MIPDDLIAALDANALPSMRVYRTRRGFVRVSMADTWSTTLWPTATCDDLIRLVEDMASEASTVEVSLRPLPAS